MTEEQATTLIDLLTTQNAKIADLLAYQYGLCILGIGILVCCVIRVWGSVD